MLTKLLSIVRLLTIKKVGMIDSLSKLNDNVLIKRDRGALFDGGLLKKLTIDLLLLLSDSNCHMYFDFRRHVLLDLLLDPTEHERSKDLMQLGHDLCVALLSFIISQAGILGTAKVEPSIELLT